MPRGNRYQVKPNESLLQIAQGQNLPYEALLQANRGISRVSTGQVINLPSAPQSSFISPDAPFAQMWKNWVVQPLHDAGLYRSRMGANGGTLGDKLYQAAQASANRPIGALSGNLQGSGGNITPQGTVDLATNTVQGLTGGSGQDLYRPSTTVNFAQQFKNSPDRLASLQSQLEMGATPTKVNPYDAQALGMTEQDMVRAGYRFDSSTATYVYAGADTAATTTSSGSGSGPAPGTLGAAVQYNLSIGNRRKASKLQRYENYLERQKFSWTDKNRQKAARDRRRRRNYLASRKEQQTQQTQNDQGAINTAGGYGLVDFSWRTSTG